MTSRARTRPAVHGDRGLQPERTSLAWTRTLLSLAAVAGLCLRFLPEVDEHAWGAMIPAFVMVYAVTALVRVPAHRRRICVRFAEEAAAPAVRRARALVVAVIAVASAALVVVLL